jgi:uncharacterized protein DUF3617
MRHWGFILLLAASPAWADLEPGNWEITARTEVQGVQDPKAFTQTQCLTREQAADPGGLFGNRGTSCEFLNKNDSGSLITFDVACATQPPLRGSGKVSYSSQSLEGDLELRLEGFTTRSHISGRRLGGC